MPVTLRKRSTIKAPNKLGFAESRKPRKDSEDAHSESEGDLIELDFNNEPSRRTREPWEPTSFQRRLWPYKFDALPLALPNPNLTKEKKASEVEFEHDPGDVKEDVSKELTIVTSEQGNKDVDFEGSQCSQDAMTESTKRAIREGSIDATTEREIQDIEWFEPQSSENTMLSNQDNRGGKVRRNETPQSTTLHGSFQSVKGTRSQLPQWRTSSARGAQTQSPMSGSAHLQQWTASGHTMTERPATAHREAELANNILSPDLEIVQSEPRSHIKPLADTDKETLPASNQDSAKKVNVPSAESPGNLEIGALPLHVPSQISERSQVTATPISEYLHVQNDQPNQPNTFANPRDPPFEFVNLRELEIVPTVPYPLFDEYAQMEASQQHNANELTDEEALTWIASAEEGFYPHPEVPDQADDRDRPLSPRSAHDMFWHYPYRQIDMSSRYLRRAGPMDEVLDMETSSEEDEPEDPATAKGASGRSTEQQQAVADPQANRVPAWKELAPPVALGIYEGVLEALRTDWGDNVEIEDVLGLDDDDFEALEIYMQSREEQIEFEDHVADELQKRQIEIIKDYQAKPNAREEAEAEAMEKLKSREGPDFLRVEASKIEFGKKFLSTRGMNQGYLDGWADALAGQSSVEGWDEIFERDKQRKEREKQQAEAKNRKRSRTNKSTLHQDVDSEPEISLTQQALQAVHKLDRSIQEIIATQDDDDDELVEPIPTKGHQVEEKGDSAYRPRASGTRRPNIKYIKKKAAMKGTPQRLSRLSEIKAQHTVSSSDKETTSNRWTSGLASEASQNMAYMDENMKQASLTPRGGNEQRPANEQRQVLGKNKNTGTPTSQMRPAGRENMHPSSNLSSHSFAATQTPDVSLPIHLSSLQMRGSNDNMDIDGESSEEGEPAEGARPRKPKRTRRSDEARRLPSRYSDDIVGGEVAAQVGRVVRKSDKDDADSAGTSLAGSSRTQPGTAKKQLQMPARGPEVAGDITVIDDYVSPPHATKGPAGENKPPGRGQPWKKA